MKRILVLFLIIGGNAWIPMHAGASSAVIGITEIMYDADDSDMNREWIEVYNASSGPIDLASWKLFEGNANHGLALIGGSAVLQPGGYAVIADNGTAFLADHAGFMGSIFDSSFSLSNTGESIALKDASGVVIDEVLYNSDQGANGDGTSLQKINSSWVAAAATPGAANGASGSGAESETQQVSSGSASQQEEPSGVQTLQPYPIKPLFVVDAGADKKSIAGSLIRFQGKALGTAQEPLDGGRFLWNFGDGMTKEGRVVDHIYRFPGEYIASLSVSSNTESASDYLRITVIPNSITLSEVAFGNDGFVEIQNNARDMLDIGSWIITENETKARFIIPDGTLIGSYAAIAFPNEQTGILTGAPLHSTLVLSYPNNRAASSVVIESPVLAGGSYAIAIDGNVRFAGVPTPGVRNSVLAESTVKKTDTRVAQQEKTPVSLATEEVKKEIASRPQDGVAISEKNTDQQYAFISSGGVQWFAGAAIMSIIAAILFVLTKRFLH